jgi:hypothetical protein
VIFVDPKTKQVHRLEQYEQDDEGIEAYKRGIEVLEYNQVFDPRLFEPNFPKGTIVIDQAAEGVGMAQGDLNDKAVASEVLRRALEAWRVDDYDTAGRLFGGASKDFFLQRAFDKPLSDIVLKEPKWAPVVYDRSGYKIVCRYIAEREGRRTMIQKVYYVTTLSGHTGRWFVTHVTE